MKKERKKTQSTIDGMIAMGIIFDAVHQFKKHKTAKCKKQQIMRLYDACLMMTKAMACAEGECICGFGIGKHGR